MARYVAVADGNLSTAATWNTVTNTPTIHASTNITLGATSLSATFTAPNTTNACVGLLVHQVATNPTTDTYTFTLQQNTVDTACAVSIPYTQLYDDTAIFSKWYFVKFPTPYVFTSTTAGYYRFKITRSGSSTNYRLAADSGGSNFAFMAVDNRTATPTAGDDIYVIGANGTGTVTVTIDGTAGSIGAGTDVTGITTRSIGQSIIIGCGGLLKHDTSASSTLQCKGTAMVYGASFNKGEYQAGTAATCYPTGKVATLTFNENGTTTQYGLEYRTFARVQLHGEPKTTTSLWKTKYVSGTGTSASPLVVSTSVDWSVGDEIIVGATGNSATNYSESENKFIKTKNSATSYVLSDTVGGAEAALTYTHTTNSEILNVQRNVIINTTNASHGWYVNGDCRIVGDIDVDWTRMEYLGSITANKFGGNFNTNAPSYSSIDYNVFYKSLYVSHYVVLNKTVETYTGNIGVLNSSASTVSQDFYLNASNNKTYIDCYSIKSNRIGFYITASAALTFTRCKGISNNINGGANGTWLFNNAFAVTMTDCEAQAGRTYAITPSGNTAGIVATGFLSGTYAKNQLGMMLITDSTLQGMLFTNMSTDSGTLIIGNTGMITGSVITFETLENTTNNHRWYSNGGYFQSTGYGLTDTTVWKGTVFGAGSSGELAIKADPDSTSTNTLIYSFYPNGKVIGNQQYKNIDIACRVKIADSSFYDDTFLVRLRAVYDGTTTTSVSATGTTNAQQLTLHIVPQTTNPRIDVYIDLTSHEAGALADVYIGEFNINLPGNTSIDNTRFSLWSQGMPLVPDTTLPTPTSVWIASDQVDYGTNTIGNRVKKLKNPSLIIDGEIIV